MSPVTPAERDVYTPSRLNLEARTLLEGHFPLLWIVGELSNLARPASGHLYFSLKDARAQVRCAMFRNRNRTLRFRPNDGQQVLLRARVGLYEGRGEFQLIVESMEEAGHGALQRAYDELRARLEAEGLFAEALKRPLPAVPRQLGVITSASGAALRDILHVLARRFPALPVVVYPATVQGDEAPAALRAALATAVRRAECDVLLLARGGGSLEDLWAFNDEALARAIADCPIPVVSAVGHEVDFTIADFVADVRAPTPSGAAEIVVPDQHDWLRRIEAMATRIARVGQRMVEDEAQRVDWCASRMVTALRRQLLERQHDVQALRGELVQLSPAVSVQRSIGRLTALRQRLGSATHDSLSQLGHRVALLGRALHSVSPLATLERGYAIVLDADGKAMTDAATAKEGDEIRARLSKGELAATVTKVVKE